MAPDVSFKILGLVSVLIMLPGFAFLLYKWPGEPTMSLSEHAAQTKPATVYYAAFLIPSVTLFYLFVTKWFIPEFQLKHVVVYILAVGVVGQYVACLVPDTTGWSSTIHRIAAYGMSVTLAIILGYTIFAPGVSSVARWLDAAALLVMLYLYGLFLLVPKARQKFLIYQSSYVALFFASIMATAYIR